MSINDIIPWLSLFFSGCVAVGGFIAYRFSYNKTSGEIQERVIGALKTETETLRTQVADHEKEIARLRGVIETVKEALSKEGIRITIDGEMVMIQDANQGGKAYHRTPRPSRTKKPDPAP